MISQIHESQNKSFTEAAAWLQARLLEAKALRLTERLLASVERSELQRTSNLHDTSGIVAARDRVAEAIKNQDSALLEQAREELLSEIQCWQLALKQLDSQIQAYNLRRFCDRTSAKLDLQIYAALVRFYRNLSHIGQAQSKYDFAVTRLFIQNQTSASPSLRFGRRQISGHLIKMFNMWDDSETAPHYTSDQVTEGVARFEEFIEALNNIQHPEELVSTDLFNRIRACKKEIGEAFYSPEVTAVAVECNVLGNQLFARLTEIEGDELTESSSAIRALTGVLNDSPDAPSLTGLLRELEQVKDQKEDAERERLTRVVSLLRIVGGTTAPLLSSQDSSSVDENAAEEVLPEVSIPESLLQNPEYQEIIERVRKASAKVHALDLLMFLQSPEATSDQTTETVSSGELAELSESHDLRRQALELILDADHLLHHELGAEGAVGEDLEPRLTDLIGKMQKNGSRIRKITEQAVRLEQRAIVDAHLYITNHLLEGELELQSAIVRHSARELARAEAERLREEKEAEAAAAREARAAANAVAKEEKAREKEKQGKKIPLRTKMLVASAAALLLIAVGLHFTTPNSQPKAAISPDVNVLNVSTFPSAELLRDARIKQEYLFCIVSEKWQQTPLPQQREIAKAWFTFLENKKITSISLISEKGEPAGGFTREQIFPPAK